MRVDNTETLTLDDLQFLSKRELRSLLKEVKLVGRGIRDIVWQHAIEDELSQRDE